jgi:tripartite-type tricarboxylate transporter receptor subunit TctC
VTYRREILRSGAALAGGLILGRVWAQTDYPSKPIRLVVPAAPGGGTDAMARLIANALGESRKWQMVVENMPGAGGNIGMEQVARSGKDGYTIGIGESSNMVINPYLYGRMPFNVETDLEPVVLLAKVPLVLVVAANSRFDSVPSLIEAARQKPLSFASAGNGTVGHLMGELWKRRVGIPMTHIPYKSAAPAMTDVAGGHVDLFFASITSALPMIKAGKVRSLVVTSATRAQLLREVPSLNELGYKDVDASVIFGIMAPKGTPGAVVSRLNIEINSVLATPSARQTLSALGADSTVYGGDAKIFSAFLWQERQKWSKVVKDSGARVD